VIELDLKLQLVTEILAAGTVGQGLVVEVASLGLVGGVVPLGIVLASLLSPLIAVRAFVERRELVDHGSDSTGVNLCSLHTLDWSGLGSLALGFHEDGVGSFCYLRDQGSNLSAGLKFCGIFHSNTLGQAKINALHPKHGDEVRVGHREDVVDHDGLASADSACRSKMSPLVMAQPLEESQVAFSILFVYS
jgi:hypothetical protein